MPEENIGPKEREFQSDLKKIIYDKMMIRARRDTPQRE